MRAGWYGTGMYYYDYDYFDGRVRKRVDDYHKTTIMQRLGCAVKFLISASFSKL